MENNKVRQFVDLLLNGDTVKTQPRYQALEV